VTRSSATCSKFRTPNPNTPGPTLNFKHQTLHLNQQDSDGEREHRKNREEEREKEREMEWQKERERASERERIWQRDLARQREWDQRALIRQWKWDQDREREERERERERERAGAREREEEMETEREKVSKGPTREREEETHRMEREREMAREREREREEMERKRQRQRQGLGVRAPPPRIKGYEGWVEGLLEHLRQPRPTRWVPVGSLGHAVVTPLEFRGKVRQLLQADRRFVVCPCQGNPRVRAAGPDSWPHIPSDCKSQGRGAGHA
jgi:hypothetical protein